MKITVDVNVPSGPNCYEASGAPCPWRNSLDSLCGRSDFDRCFLHESATLDDAGKCYDCLRACVIALEAGKEREDG